MRWRSIALAGSGVQEVRGDAGRSGAAWEKRFVRSVSCACSRNPIIVGWYQRVHVSICIIMEDEKEGGKEGGKEAMGRHRQVCCMASFHIGCC
jgi:hypothetical protein